MKDSCIQNLGWGGGGYFRMGLSSGWVVLGEGGGGVGVDGGSIINVIGVSQW